MKRKSNWLKNLLQWGTLAAIVGFVVYGLTLGEKPADVEAYCPFGGLQAGFAREITRPSETGSGALCFDCRTS